MSFLTTPLRGLAALLRAGAGLLDQIAGGERPPEPRQEPRPARPTASRRRTPAAAKQPPKRRATAKRSGRTRSAAAKDLDDVTIARKVETELFRDPTVPKGHIDVNVAGGVVWLRGEVKTPADIRRLETLAQAIPEVTRVENLLHLPKTPAPTRSDPPARRRTKLTPERVTAERPTPGAEPSPAELASRREGRPPAPLGSRSNGGGESG
jgi:hypothetical protein